MAHMRNVPAIQLLPDANKHFKGVMLDGPTYKTFLEIRKMGQIKMHRGSEPFPLGRICPYPR
jgi:hypothetical protein